MAPAHANNSTACIVGGKGASKSCSHDPGSIVVSQEAVEGHWEALPPSAKIFILCSADGLFPLEKLIDFWSQPHVVECTRGDVAGRICGAAWYLALSHLRMRRWSAARALTINGAFIHQCYNTSIEEVVETFRFGDRADAVLEASIPDYVRGFRSVRSPEAMEAHIRRYLPEEYTQSMNSYANLSTSALRMSYIDQICDEYSSLRRHRSAKPTKDDGVQKIKIILIDDTDDEQNCRFDIGSSTKLKVLFNDYAENRGASLRSLRFTYAGKALFLSSAGNKTPEDMGMKDLDVIKVHMARTPEAMDSKSVKPSASHLTPAKTKSKRRYNKIRGKNKRRQMRHREKPAASLAECKVVHSQKLTEIHEEARPRFDLIRRRLNNLVMERAQPKTICSRPPNKEPNFPSTLECSQSLGGKAGKSCFFIQVGEVKNLYKTTKPSALASHSSMHALLPTLDLHGSTRAEALAKLDESLEVWVESAMRGGYPFVRPGAIVCGCGDQILSETVQDWIRSNDRVSNAPGRRSSRR